MDTSPIRQKKSLWYAVACLEAVEREGAGAAGAGSNGSELFSFIVEYGMSFRLCSRDICGRKEREKKWSDTLSCYIYVVCIQFVTVSASMRTWIRRIHAIAISIGYLRRQSVLLITIDYRVFEYTRPWRHESVTRALNDTVPILNRKKKWIIYIRYMIMKYKEKNEWASLEPRITRFWAIFDLDPVLLVMSLDNYRKHPRYMWLYILLLARRGLDEYHPWFRWRSEETDQISMS